MKACVFDTETSISSSVHGALAKDPSNDFYTLIYGTDPENIEVEHYDFGFKDTFLKRLPVSLTKADLLVGVNMPFDLAYIIDFIKKDEKIRLTWDCQIFHYLYTGQRHSYPSLAELQEIYLGKKTKESRISYLYSKKIGADRIVQAKDRCPRLWKLYNKYCVEDGKTPLLIAKKQLQLAKETGMLPLVIMYNKFMVCLSIMMSYGFHIDTNHVEKTINTFKLKTIETLTEAFELIKDYWCDPKLPSFKLSSPQHKSALFFGGYINNCKHKVRDGFYKNGNEKYKTIIEDVYIEGFGLDPDKYSEKTKIEGRYKVDSAAVHKIYSLEKNELVKKYCKLQLKAMKYEKMVSTYLQPFLKYSINNVLYPSFNNVAVITGRLSSSKPNWQNIPSKGDHWQDIQRSLIAPPGYICCSIDYSQLEIYIAAWNSNDDVLWDDILNGIDFHCQSLAFAKQKTYEEVYKLCKLDDNEEWNKLRTKAKAITFQKEYGASAKRVAKETGLDETFVQTVFNELDKKYWKLKLFKDYVFESASRNKKVSTVKYLPASQKKGGKNGRRFNVDGYELLPVVIGDTRSYYDDYIRNVGYYRMPHGKLYSFEEYGNLDKHNNVRVGISPTETKNYTIQGGAADVVAATSIEIMEYCLTQNDNVRYISQIHDAFLFYIKEDEASLHIPKLCDIMENVPYAVRKHLKVEVKHKFKVEAKYGYNFAEMQNFSNGEG